MCGIFGLALKNGTTSPELLTKATRTLTHRGPDGGNYWLDERGAVGLGHARLSIIDLEGGTQPLHNEDRTIHAVVNGEIYDYERIIEQLKRKGHRFATASDSEVLIHLYEDLGTEAVRSMRGEFAFILWDERQGRLFTGRDRFGIKPLYYTMQNGNIYLASEIKALLAAGIPAYWDEESLYIASFLGGVPLQDRTLFRNVFQVPPGCILTGGKDGYQIRRYWDFDYPTLDIQANKRYVKSEAIEQFRYMFEESVRLRLRADVPVGVYLSGGIDSCSILGTVAKLRGSGTKAFTISFWDADYDELAVAREMAALTGTEFNAFPMTPELLAENFIDAIYHGETLMANAHSVAKFILSKHVREAGYKVVLTGEGSDEILGGYAHFRQDMLLYDPEYQQAANTNTAYSQLKQRNSVSQGFLISKKLFTSDNTLKKRLGFIPSFLFPFISGGIRAKSMINKKVFARIPQRDPYAKLLEGIDVENQLTGRHILNQSLYLWSKLMLPNYLLANLGDRMEMAHSVEGRVPFLDHKLVEFVVPLPVSFKIHGMQEKYLLREALRPVLTPTVYKRQKHPFLAPPTAGNRLDPMFRFLHHYIGDNAHKLPYFSPLKIKSLMKILPVIPAQTRRLLDPVLVIFASMIALQERFGLELK